MKTKFFIWTLLLFTACSNPVPKPTADLVMTTTSEPQQFVINAKEGATLIGKNGTLVYIPKSAFLCGNESVDDGDVTIELVEGLDGNSIVENKLSTITTDGQLLETVGMLYFNATKEGCENLTFNPNNPTIAKLPSNALLENVQVFDSKMVDGTIVWDNPRAIENKPTLVPLEELNFYVDIKDKNLMDTKKMFQGYGYNSNHQPIQKKLIQDVPDRLSICGLNSEIVKILYSKKFENTLISTLEFEQRMKFIHKSCSEEVMRLYIKHLDKNLWEIDEIVASFLESKTNPQATTFRAFARLKLTRPDGVSPISMKNIRDAIKKSEAKQKELQDYQEALTIYYSVNLSSLGWINCDRFSSLQNTIFAKLKVQLSNVSAESDVSVTVIFSSINSAICLWKDEKGFYVLESKEEGMKVPQNETVILVANSLEKSIPHVVTKTIVLGNQTDINLVMEPKSLDDYKKLIHQYFKPKEKDKVSTKSSDECCVTYPNNTPINRGLM